MGLSLLVAVLLSSGDPYVRSRVDTGILRDPRAHCLWWDQPEVVFHQNLLGNPETRGETEFDATRRSLATWNSVSQGCGHLTVREGERVADRTIGIDSSGGTNRNIVVYREVWCSAQGVVPQDHRCWDDDSCMNTHDCWHGPKGVIALTTTTYETRTGRIFDADVELNAAWFVFTTVDAPPCTPPVFHQGCVATDVENTMTHELGHALGLDHTSFPNSTMNATAPGGETSKRTLDSGSRQFICDVYPQGAPARDCVILAANPVLGASRGCAAAGGIPAGLGLIVLLAFWRRMGGAR